MIKHTMRYSTVQFIIMLDSSKNCHF